MWFDQLIFALVLAVMVALLALRRVSPTMGVVGALGALFLFGLIDSTQLLVGFAGPAPATIACLYVVAAGVDRAGALDRPIRRILDRPSGSALNRLLLAAAAVSAVVANTPIVAMLISPLTSWAERQRIRPSRVLIPLSYATLLGGMLTLIGTSTNLVGSGVLTSLGYDPIGMVEPLRVALPVTIVGLVVIFVLGPRVLPDRGAGVDNEVERPYTVSFRVVANGPLIDRSVADAGLRDLPGMYLVGVEREGELLAPVPPAHELRGGDLLSFAGQVDRVVELQRTPGLVFEENHHIDALDGAHGWFEVVVGPGSSLVGQTIKEAGFRSRYQAAVVALHRSGSPVDGRLGDARVRVGDALLVVADSGFRDRWKDRSDFLLIRGRSEAPPALTWMAPLSLLILAGVAGLPLIGLVSVLKAAVLGAVAMVLAGVLTPRQARDSVDLNVVLLIAAAIGIGAGAESIGIPSRLADVLLSSFGQFGLWGSALGIVIASLLLTELVSNAAAVALVVPMAVRAAEQSGGDVRLFALGATLAASASFLTPIGYQTNTMVYGPGRYHFADYLRLGIPLTLVVVIIMPVMMSLD